MHKYAPDDPDLMAIGSSVTWRNLDFSAVDQTDTKATTPINAAPCFLTVNQTAYLAAFYLDTVPSVRTVLTVFAMRDFENCVDDGAFFNRTLARLYVTHGLPGLPLYFVNFRPNTFAYDFNKIKDMRTHADAPYSMVMDRYGSSPYRIEPPEIREDMRVDPACFPYLAAMEADLAERGIRWIVALMPAMPAWIDHYDPGGERDAAWRRSMKATLTSPNTVLIDGADGPLGETHHFTDPAHLHWNNVPRFTRWIFAKVNGAWDDALDTGG